MATHPSGKLPGMCPGTGSEESRGSTPVNLLGMLALRLGGEGKDVKSAVKSWWGLLLLLASATPMPVASSRTPGECGLAAVMM